MKKSLLIISFSLLVQLHASLNWPVQNFNTWNSTYNAFKAYYSVMGGYHPGVDISLAGRNDVGQNVYPIAEGTIYRIIPYKSTIGGAVVMKHNINGKIYYSVYYHIQPKSYLTVDETPVKTSTIIGTVGNISKFGPHLHLEVRTKMQKNDLYPNDMGNGYYKTTALIDRDGLIDPIAFIKNTSLTSSQTSIVDGAGSLVSPNENIAGGNHDYALMNPHNSSKSTVVFQWLYNIDSCSHIDLFAYPNALDVTIQAKKWSGHSMKKAFNVTLNPYNKNNLEDNSNTLDLSNGISLEQAETNCNGDDIVGCDWTTLAVTSQRPLRRGEYIIAHCRDNSASIKRGNRKDITPTLVNLPSDYFWTGTGSLISKIGNRNFEEAGVGKDYAVTYNSNKSFTTFQWYASDICRKVKVKGYKEGYSSINEVSIKKWDDNSWSSNKCGNSLPCTISAPILNKYYIIKVKGNAGAIKTGYLQTECVQ